MVFGLYLGLPKATKASTESQDKSSSKAESSARSGSKGAGTEARSSGGKGALTVNEFVARTKRYRERGLEPTKPELIAYARYLGIDPITDGDFMWIADEALAAPLPSEWTEHHDSADRVFYYNVQTHASSWTHPLEQLHRDTYKSIVHFRSGDISKEDQIGEIDRLKRKCDESERDSIKELQAWSEHTDEGGQRFFYNRDKQVSGSYSLSALQLLVTNLHVSQETMQEAVKCLIEAKADVNSELSETPLLSALQSRCVEGLRALSEHGARVSSDVLDELKTISSCKVRSALEDILQPLIVKDKRLRCPLWIWVQLGAVQAAEAIVRNASHDEEIDVDVLVALQRCRGPTEDKEEISNLLQEHLGDEEFNRLGAAAATRRLLSELREAHTEEREPELDLVLEALAQGANPNAQEEDEDETDEEDAEDEEEEADGSMEEDEVAHSDDDKAAEMFEEDDREDGETEPEGEWDEES